MHPRLACLAVAFATSGLIACSEPSGFSASSDVVALGVNASAWGPETPPFNFEAILRGDNGAFGHVKVRQPNDAELVFRLDPWVRNLAPNTSYRLQRAVDTDVNDVCTGTAWLTLGEGPTPHAIVTDDRGTGRAALWRAVTSPIGAKFDVHFRVIKDGTSVVVLESDCYQFVITQ